ncbi:hypothetical protein [Bradyrhizobium canariense]|uniref:ABC transporter substrate-binding protein n=1 Tax=Bradyrhizobium canariense TaxID=255045 RepID=A0A1H2BGJ1_9BRAD|nr:hypothetical protein [Bradyrhizobium canariense]SDT57365.1 hypothetical protein SAMN05444158_7156 [Bradyrhizobium canariense]
MRFFAIAWAAVTALVTTQAAAQRWPPRIIANKPHTLFVGANGPLLFAPEIARHDPYSLKRDFVPITSISMAPLVLGFMRGIQVLTALPQVKARITGTSPAMT